MVKLRYDAFLLIKKQKVWVGLDSLPLWFGKIFPNSVIIWYFPRKGKGIEIHFSFDKSTSPI